MKKLFYVITIIMLITTIPGMVNAFDNPSTGSIQGTVSDASTGNPIQGATVKVYGNPSTNTQTDSSGYYLLTGVKAQNVQIYAQDSGYTPAVKWVQVVADDTVTKDISLVPIPPSPPSGSIEGTVTDATTGNPIKGVSVSVNDSSNIGGGTQTDSTGFYILTGVSTGSTEIHFTKYGYNYNTQHIEVLANDTIEVDASLDPKTTPSTSQGTIIGTVTNASTGDPIAGATVTVTSNGYNNNLIWPKTITGTDGSYVLTGISAGSTVVYATAFDFQLGYQAAVVIANDTIIVNLGLTPKVQATKGAVSGTVTDADTGDPIAGAIVYARPSSESHYSAQYQGKDCDGNQYSMTDSTGFYILKSLYAGDYNVTASKKGYQCQTQPETVVGSSTVTLNFALQTVVVNNGSISGTVSDASTGNPIQGAFVFVSIDLENWYGHVNHYWAQTDSTGFYQLDNIPAGTQNVKAMKKGYNYSEQSVTVVANDTVTANFELNAKTPPATGTIIGTVSDASTGDPIAGAKVFVREGVYDLAIGSDKNFTYTTTDSNGNYAINGVSTGTRYVVALDQGYQSSEQQGVVVANDTTQIDFSLVPYGDNTSSVKVHIIQKNRAGTKYMSTPASGATVFVPANNQVLPTSSWDNNWSTTDSSGDAQISNIPSGDQMVVVLKDGYDSSLVDTTLNGGITTITIELTPSK